jgi:hypothetical protein
MEAPVVIVLDNFEPPWEGDREATEHLITALSVIPGLAPRLSGTFLA